MDIKLVLTICKTCSFTLSEKRMGCLKTKGADQAFWLFVKGDGFDRSEILDVIRIGKYNRFALIYFTPGKISNHGASTALYSLRAGINNALYELATTPLFWKSLKTGVILHYLHYRSEANHHLAFALANDPDTKK